MQKLIYCNLSYYGFYKNMSLPPDVAHVIE